MARPIQHDPQEVVRKTMHLFWKKGYESTSVQDIVKETGLKPGSLYNIFGNKEGIFGTVLELYSTQSLKTVKETLQATDDYKENIKNFLNEIVITTIANEKTNGCLLVKTLLVVSHKDEKIQKKIVAFFDEVEQLLKEILGKAKHEGKTSVDPTSFSKFIISTIYGSHVYYKASKDENALRENVALVLELLNQ